jgi:serine protease Do
VVRPEDQELQGLLDRFVCVRLTRMNDIDISLFQFDYDLTWVCFFLDGNDRIYSRYGGRDAGHAEGRVSVAGLKHTMEQVLADHSAPATTAPPREPTPAHQVFTRSRGCMHCHNVWQGLREKARADKAFTRDMLFVYPLPENIGLKLDVIAGNRIREVIPRSPAAHAGMEADDELTKIDATEVRSQGDVMHALHLAPAEGELVLHWRRAGHAHRATLEVTRGWKQTNLAWRASMRLETK